MTLECTLVRGPEAPGWSAPEELTIAVANGISGLHVQSLLQEYCGASNLSVSGHDLSALTVGVPPLVSGAVIVEGQAPRLDLEPASLPLMLLTHSGPGAGTVFQLKRGRFIIGRGPVDIQVPDPGMSREHAVLEVSSTTLTLHEVKAPSPVLVNGQPKHRESVTSESTVQCGNSTFSVLTESGPFPVISNDAGRSVANPIEVPFARSAGHRMAIALTAGLPLVAGIGLAVATGMWMYLGFTVISAVTLLVPLATGHRSRREGRRAVAHAVREDIDRRRQSSPSAAEIVVAAHRSVGLPQRIPDAFQGMTRAPLAAASPAGAGNEPPGVWVRLGITAAVANIRLVPDDPRYRPPPIGPAAVTLDPRHPVVGLRGHPAHVDALLRFVVVQLSSYPCAAELPVVILGPVGRLPMSSRFLPRVTLVTDQDAALTAVRRQKHVRGGRLIVIADPTLEGYELPPSLLEVARGAEWQVVCCSDSSNPAWPAIDISPSGTSGHLILGGERQPFIPDFVPAAVFDGYCRSVAALKGLDETGGSTGVPDRCSLTDLLPSGQRRILRRWDEPTLHNGLRAPLGRGHDGWVSFDFKVDGPHLLVGGTTGSGKSELLRTLIASLALNYPPDHTTFFFFDFKGGSGLRPLAGLPHCVGLLTDLGPQHLDRALASLRSEIRYREEVFAEAGASDLAQYRRSRAGHTPVIPHLVLVIDEFRMLIDDAPGALRELMRVATIGRSLGVHLVMATQRPQGALTADIRANVTSSIALRVQSNSESVDIINSKAAALIPVDAPGRAYLAKASTGPQEFQAATLAVHPELLLHDEPVKEDHAQRVQPAAQALQQNSTVRNVGRHQDAPSEAGALQLVSAMQDAWQVLGRSLPRRPVAAPLPSSIPWQTQLPSTTTTATPLDSKATAPWVVGPVALVDSPSQQRVDPLLWFPAEQGHLAMIGSASSGLDDCFRATSAMFAAQEPQPHVYILDGAGFMRELTGRGGVGAIAGLHQVQLAARVLRRLAEEMENRRSAGASQGAYKPLGLIVTGWCSWAATFRAGPFAWAEGIFQDIVRDGGPLGIIVLMCGERELVSSRFFAAMQNRAFFPCGSTEESRFHWPRLPEVEPVPGRAVLTGSWVDGHTVVAQFRQSPLEGSWPYGNLGTSAPPFRVLPLPDQVSRQEFHDRLKAARIDRTVPEQAVAHLAPGAVDQDADPVLWIGLAGDEAMPASLPLLSGGVSLILGGHGTGKSSALGALQTLNPLIPWIAPPDRTSHDEFWASTAREEGAGNLDPNSVLLVDNADSLDIQGRQALSALHGKVHGIVLTATPGPGLVHHLPLAREVQTARMGLVLAPGSPHDGELLGVRLDADPTARPGRGYIVNGTDVRPFQGAL
jgi:S-DNA-T family DNA segregation ATPase FtsK/SpoIIIE